MTDQRSRLLRQVSLVTFGLTMFSGTSAWAQQAEVPTPVAADPAPATDVTPQDTVGLEDIVVTAQKSEQNLQKIPIAITAVTSETIASRGFTNVSQIAQTVPNLTFDSASPVAGSSAAAVVFLRGVGQTDFLLTTDPGVGTYVNDVYMSRSIGGVLNLLDIDRIEVLRGPQGTLFGRNTIGGAIAVTTGKPKNETEGVIEVTTGSYKRADIRGILNVPIINDKLAFRMSFSSKTRDGYIDRVLAGDKAGNENQQSARAALRWWATDNLTIDLDADATRGREQAQGATMLATDQEIQASSLGALFNACVSNAIPGCAARLPVSEQHLYDTSYVTHDPYKTNSTNFNVSDLDIIGTSLTAAWRLGSVNLKSITAFRHMKSHFGYDTDGTPLSLGATDDRWTHNQFSQEFQVTGKAFDDRLSYLAGAFYFNENGLDTADVPLYTGLFPALGIPVSVSGYIRVKNSNYGFFSQLTYALTDALRFTVGGRYSHERKYLDVSKFLLKDLGIPLVADPYGSKDFNKFTPKVSIDWQATPRTLFYASYSQGFKAGGFTGRYTEPRQTVDSFAPETVTSFEIGSKNELFDRHLRLNLAAYRANYRNIQIVVQENITPLTRNAAKGRIQGFEVEATALPFDGLELSYALGYTDAKYLKITDPRAQITTSDLFVDTPKWNMSGGIQYTFDLGSAGSIIPRADASYRTEQAKDAINTPEIVQKAYALVDVHLTYRTPKQDFQVSAFVTNLTNKAYLISGLSSLPSLGIVDGIYARPREWGLSVTKKF